MRIRQTLKRAAAAGATILAATTIYLVGAGAHTPAALAQSGDAATPTPSPTASRPPSTTGVGISIMNPNPDGGYYAAGDVIKFKVPMAVGTRLRPIVVNETISSGTSFQFRYTDNTGHPAYREPQTANLAAVVEQGVGQDQYLIYEHTVDTAVSTNAAGTVYYATDQNRDLYKVHDSVCGPTADNCLKLTFTQPAGTNPSISGVVSVAAGGAWNYAGRSGDKPTTSLSKVRLVDPPADGKYKRGDTVRLQAEYDKRLHPVTDGSGGDRLTLRVNNSNAALPDDGDALTFREAYLHSVSNAGDRGYAEFRYTVLEKDTDSNGIQVNNFTKTASTKICPEVIGAGCANDATVENSGDRELLDNTALHGRGLDWSGVNRLHALSLVTGVSQAPTSVVAAVSTPNGSEFAKPLYYKVTSLPPGMEATYAQRVVSIGGTPTKAGTFPTMITAVDGVRQEISHTVNITVTDPNGPSFSAARNDLVVYQDDASQGNQEGNSSNVLTLPAVSGGTLPIAYKVSGISANSPGCGTHASPPLQFVSRPVASGPNQPGTVSVKAGNYRPHVDHDYERSGNDRQAVLPSQQLVLQATDASGRSVCWPFSVSVVERSTLGAPSLVGNEARYFAGEKIAFDVPVTNGPVTVAQGEGKAQPQLLIQIGNTNTNTRTNTRTATYVNAGGGEADPHTGSTLRFEYTLNQDSARTDENLDNGRGFVKATGMTQRENVTDPNGHVSWSAIPGTPTCWARNSASTPTPAPNSTRRPTRTPSGATKPSPSNCPPQSLRSRGCTA